MGPLKGIRIVEIAGVGPGPFCAMMLADMGAEVIRVDRVEPVELGIDKAPRYELLNRGRRSVAIDLKRPDGVEAVRRLAGRADGLIEGFRPGVMERLGLGPEPCLAANPRLVYGRVTGWGQDGPLAGAAGHDINYIALAGALGAIGRAGEKPVPPLNLVGDFGGGGMLLAFGMVCALLETSRSGKGQVVDAAMIDGAALLMMMIVGLRAGELWSDRRGENVLDGGAPWYDAYETADGGYVTIGAIEGRFYAQLLDRLGLAGEALPAQHDRAGWPLLRERFAAVLRTRTRDEWCSRLEGSDVCFAPVLTIGEAPRHPHHRARGAFVEIDGIVQPAPAPRFSRTAPDVPAGAPAPGADTDAVLRDWGFADAEIARLRENGAIGG
ncbi:MAG TPA: CaiB/BaiF CoA-transferase family protein [Stellaceae bacterium]|jgi:alpha-methylacyl-CoA racemase